MMPTRYDPSLVEEKIYNEWISKGYFTAHSDSIKKHYSIVIPPPNITGALHLGHAINNTLQDILVRKHRMQGFDTLWVPGTDHAGIATQAVVEKRLFEQEKKTRYSIGKEGLVQKMWQWKDEYESRIIKQLKKMGCSCDWDKKRFTLDSVCAKAVRYTFFELFRQGLIFRGKRLVNWDTFLQTAVADDELYHDTVKTHIWHIRYPLTDGSGYLIVATTRPETMLGDVAVAVHPDDKRYKKFIGRSCILPILKRQIPIIADSVLVSMEFGSGCVKVTPAHDPNDYACALRNRLSMVNILNTDGTLNENAGKYKGLERYSARKAIVEELQILGLIDRMEDYTTEIAHSDRSKTPIEPMLSEQWFVRMSEIASPALDAVKSGRIKFYPQRYAKTFLDWLGEKKDWCISRQLWWGHRIPVWWARNCDEKKVKEIFANRDDIALKKEGDTIFICSRDTDISSDAIKGATIEQDRDVLDTWFSSALWPSATLGWPDNEKQLKAYYPTDVLITAREIITLWVARMVVVGLYNMKEIPFKDVVIHTVIQDGQGRPMKKSLGNGVDPEDIITLYGADALRWTLAHIATETQDVRLPVKRVKTFLGKTVNSSKHFELGRNFANKAWNVSRFVLMQVQDKKIIDMFNDVESLSLADRWIISRMQVTIKDVSNALDNYHFSESANIVYNFVWSEFCDWYVEIAKSRLSDPNTSRILIYLLDNILKLLHPFMPFITEQIWQEVKKYIPDENKRHIIIASWPVCDQKLISTDAESKMKSLMHVVSAIRNIRADTHIPRDKIIDVTVCVQKEAYREVLKNNHHTISFLSGAGKITFEKNTTVVSDAAIRVVEDIQIYIPLKGIIDIEKEKCRLKKQIDTTTKEIQSIEKRLKNPSFIQNAPEQVVSETKQRLTLLKQEKTLLETNIKLISP
ncbi:valine--tRNA ligase [bacterium Unc6]|nr:valine--tRNA ligase [bacterium Unc6]